LFLGRRKPQELLSSAKSPAERCQAEFHVGEWHLIKRDRKAASHALQVAADTCPKSLVEYGAAVVELKRLGAADDDVTTASTPTKRDKTSPRRALR